MNQWIGYALVVMAGLGCDANSAAGPGTSSSAGPKLSGAPKTAAATPSPKKEADRTVADVAAASKDHTTLVAALSAAGLVDSLASPGGVYTVFAPTNAAFEKLPPGTVDGLLKPEKMSELKAVLQHHACVPILKLSDIKDGQTQAMADGTRVTFHVDGAKVKVDDATIVATVPAMNGVVYVVDTVLIPSK